MGGGLGYARGWHLVGFVVHHSILGSGTGSWGRGCGAGAGAGRIPYVAQSLDEPFRVGGDDS